MKTIIRILPIILLSTFTFISCKKNRDLKIEPPKKTAIIVSERVAAANIYNYYGNNEKYNVVNEHVSDTVFHLIPHPLGGYYLNGPRLYFKANFDTNYIAQFKWQIGIDPLVRTAQSFVLDFEQPVGNVTIRLITSYSSKNGDGFSRTDTTNQQIFIGQNNTLFGEYEGYNTDSPNHIFKIKIGWQYDAHPSLNRSYFAVSNLPEGFPIKSEINPYSSAFGIDGPTILGGQILFYNNEWVHAVYALGKMNNNKDSITIGYNYGIINTSTPYWNPMDWTRVIQKKFIGKKL
jgi:hypothetical protein